MLNKCTLLLFVLLILLSLSSCKKKEHKNTDSSKTVQQSHLDISYPGVIKFQRKTFDWSECRGIDALKISYEEAGNYIYPRKGIENDSDVFISLKLNNGVNVDFGEKNIIVTGLKIIAHPNSVIFGDNIVFSIKDISRFEGTLKCSNKCLFRTATPISQFKIKFDGKFVVELVDEIH